MNSVASSAVFPRNWASFDEALLEKFSSCGLRYFGLFFCHPVPLVWASVWSNNKYKSSRQLCLM